MHPARPFSFRDRILCCDEVPLDRIAEQVGTPTYVYSRSGVERNWRLLKDSFASLSPRICYAVKANSNLSILRLIADLGGSFDIVSLGELFRLRQIGVPGDRIIFSGVGKSLQELQAAIDISIFCIVVESEAELRRLSQIETGGKPIPVSLRVNPDVDARTHPYISTGLRSHKFGIDASALDRILDWIKKQKNLDLIGVGAHIGSQLLQVDPYVEAFRKIRRLGDEARRKGFPVRHLDLGGGFGIPYQGEEPLDLKDLADALEEVQGDYDLIMEPGRFIVGPAGILLTRVLYRKQNQEKQFLIVDGAMNDLIRPSLYGAYHEILPVPRQVDQIQGDLVGPVCESADFFARDRTLPDLEEGQLAAVMDAGAYGFVASSNYNSRPRAAEVLVDGSRWKIIRRRETLEDLIRGEELDEEPPETVT